MPNISFLTAYRHAMGMTLEQLGARLGVNKTTVMRWERGRVPAARAVELERVLGIDRHRLRPDLWSAPRKRGAA